MLEYIKNIVHDNSIPFKTRAFKVICVVGIVVSLVSILEYVIVGASIGDYLLIISESVIFGILLFLEDRFELHDIALHVLSAVLALFVIPFAFISAGGIYGGTSWLVVSLTYMFLVYSGRQLAIFAAFTVVVDAVVCYVSMFTLGVMEVYPYQKAKTFDALFDVIMASCSIGVLITLQKSEYERVIQTNKDNQQELLRQNTSRDKFFANFSHEIRNPINAIMGLNEVNMREMTDPELINNSQSINRSSKLLLNLVNDIMDLSQIQNNSMQLVEMVYDSAEMFTELVELIRTRAEEKNLALIVELDPQMPKSLVGDERRIIQVVLNLLTNAVKYTVEGEVRLSVSTDKIDDGHVMLYIDVTDTGIGIKRENLDYIFTSYSQFDREKNARIEGNGLGLSISSELVRMMGGELSVESVYTKGSTFTFSLVQQFVGEETVGTVDIVNDNQLKDVEVYEHLFEAKKANILVVDDDETNLMIVKKLLKDTKVQVDTVTSGAKALLATASKQYNVIFVDYLMPEMNGLETLMAIRRQQDGLSNKAAVIAFTGASTNDFVLDSIDINFDKILKKPVTGAQLEQAILENLPDSLVDYRYDSSYEFDTKVRTTYIKQKKRRIKITTECVSDMGIQLANDYNIDLMYTYLKTEGARFIDTVEVSGSNNKNYISATESNVETEAASVSDYEKFFGDELVGAHEIIHIAVGSNLSNCYYNANKAAEGFKHVHVIDSRTISGGLALLAITASKWARDGMGTKDIINGINNLKDYVVFNYVVSSPDLLRRKFRFFIGPRKLYKRHNIRLIMSPCSRGVRVMFPVGGSQNKIISGFIRNNIGLKSIVNFGQPVIFNYVDLNTAGIENVQRELDRFEEITESYILPSSVTVARNTGSESMSIAYFRKNKNMY